MRGQDFLAFILFLLFIPLIIFWSAMYFLGSYIGPYVTPILEAYSSFIVIPLVYFISPESLATAFGAKKMTALEIQAFYDSAIHELYKPYPHNFMNLIFIVLMLLIIIGFYYKNGIKKGYIRWIGRYLVLNMLVTIPLWDYLIRNYSNWLIKTKVLPGKYTEIFNSMKSQVTESLIILFIVSIIVSVIGHYMIMISGRNISVRKQKWEEKRLSKGNLKRKKEVEYY